MRRKTTTNIGLAIWRLKCFYETFMQGSNSVFQMNICAEKTATSQSREPLVATL
jgi:hypothetical protein